MVIAFLHRYIASKYYAWSWVVLSFSYYAVTIKQIHNNLIDAAFVALPPILLLFALIFFRRSLESDDEIWVLATIAAVMVLGIVLFLIS